MLQEVFVFFWIFSHIFFWVITLILCVISITLGLYYVPDNKVCIMFEYLYEKVYFFYEEILGREESSTVKGYIVALFFVLFFANLLSVILDFIAPIFGVSEDGWFLLSSYILLPTSSLEFTLALSLFSVLLMLYLQYKSFGGRNFFLNYIPLTWKKYFVLESWKLPVWKYRLLVPFVFLADLVLSFFLAFLDILWLFAKIISLAFRLFGNMTSWTVLLGMVVVGAWWLSSSITEVLWGFELPIILPIIVVFQWLLVALIQAMVFPLLVAIFIRIAQMQQST